MSDHCVHCGQQTPRDVSVRADFVRCRAGARVPRVVRAGESAEGRLRERAGFFVRLLRYLSDITKLRSVSFDILTFKVLYTAVPTVDVLVSPSQLYK